MRRYEVMVILDPSLDERTVAPSLDQFLTVVRNDGGTVEKVDVWGRRRLAYDINKKSEGIYAVIDLSAEPATVKEIAGHVLWASGLFCAIALAICCRTIVFPALGGATMSPR